MLSPSFPLSPNSHAFTNPKLSEFIFWVFKEALLLRGMKNKSLVPGDQTQSPAPRHSPKVEVGGRGQKVPVPQSQCWFN